MKRPQRIPIYCNVCAGQERVRSDSRTTSGLRTLPPARGWARRTGPRYLCECCQADVTNIIAW